MDRRDFLALSGVTAVPALFTNNVIAGEMDNQNQTEPIVKIRRLNWAGIQIEFDDTTLFIDPFISKEIWGDGWTEPIIMPEARTKSKSVAITHYHNDHWDLPAIKAIYGNSKASIMCGPKTAFSIAALNVPEVRPRDLWEPQLINSGKIVLIGVPAQDFGGIEQYSWVIKTGGKTIFHGGDTLWHGFFHKIAAAYGPFDAAFLTINGVDHLQLKPHSHIPATMTPHQAAAVGEIFQSKVVVPIHYGFSDPNNYVEFPNAEKVFIEESKKRSVGVEICKPGDWITWKPNR